MQAKTSAGIALITGGSRGIGAATALALADRGYDILITYRNKAARANDVVAQATQRGVRALAIGCDITKAEERVALFAALAVWGGQLAALVLNASGGLERDVLAIDPDYAMHINLDAQVALVDLALPVMSDPGVISFITSHWAHLYGQVEQIRSYAPVAESKYAGEQALRARMAEFTARGVRLVVVTGDLIDGTITPKLLERAAPGLGANRRGVIGTLPTAGDMGEAIAGATADATLPTGHTIVIGGSLASLLNAESSVPQS